MSHRINVIGTALIAAGFLEASAASAKAPAAEDASIRPFRVNVPDANVADLKRRLAATRWPDKETVADPSQGAQLAKLQELVRYWATEYDWGSSPFVSWRLSVE